MKCDSIATTDSQVDLDGRIHRFHLIITPLNEAQDWIADHREFWEGSLDALGELLDEMKDKKDDKEKLVTLQSSETSRS